MRNKEVLAITETSVLVALSAVLLFVSHVVPIVQMPQGGSVSLAMLPIMVVALRRGLKYGLMAGVVIGIINYFMDGYSFHWGSIFFDYLFAGMVLAVPALFMKKRDNYFILGFAFFLGGFLKYLMHSFSGVLFFTSWAADQGYTTVTGYFIYSFIIYNLPYMGLSTILTIIVGLPIKHVLFLEFD